MDLSPNSNLLSKHIVPISVNKPVKKTAPPPIFISGLNDIKEVTRELQELEFKGKITSLPSRDVKVNCLNSEEYRRITNMLNLKNKSGRQIEWHTFEDKNTRPFRVMARGFDPDTIVCDLKTKGFKIK